jgi:aminopeptidase N
MLKSENSTKYLGVTQFQTHHAREAFPCLDEPDRKAKFKVSIVHRETLTARSNMEMIESISLGEVNQKE